MQGIGFSGPLFLKEGVDWMKKRKTVTGKQQIAGWLFLAPASILIFIMSFWPMIQAFITSLKTGKGTNLKWGDPLIVNYIKNIPADKIFLRSMGNTYLYLIIEVPIMLIPPTTPTL